MSEQKAQPETNKPKEKEDTIQGAKDETSKPTAQSLGSDGGGTSTDNSGGPKSGLGFHITPS